MNRSCCFLPLVPASPRHPRRCLGHPADNLPEIDIPVVTVIWVYNGAELSDLMQAADDKFPGLVIDNWGEKWLSLDFLEEREVCNGT